MNDTLLSEQARAALRVPLLPDPWDEGGAVPLDGPLERSQFPPLLTVLLSLVAIFFLFQVVIAPATLVVLLLVNGTPPDQLVDALMNVLTAQPGLLLVANTVGQFLGIAVPALVFARLHSSRRAAFLRLRKPDPTLFVLTLLALVALVPLVQWLAQMSDALPWPEWVRSFEQAQLDLIEQVLGQQIGLMPTLFMLAITPALCEELFFRGYVQRQAERGLGIVGGILFTGILFGLFHLRITQALPLSVLGVYLAYITWRTGSLWPAVVVHFLNNGLAVVVGAYVAARPDLEVTDLEKIPVPWYVLVPALVFFVLFVYAIQQTARARLQQRRPDAGAPEASLTL